MPPRVLLPKDEHGLNEGSSSSTSSKASKRKAVSSACIPCRKRKSKASRPAQSPCIGSMKEEPSLIDGGCSVMEVYLRVQHV